MDIQAYHGFIPRTAPLAMEKVQCGVNQPSQSTAVYTEVQITYPVLPAVNQCSTNLRKFYHSHQESKSFPFQGGKMP